MTKTFARFMKDESGATAIEYGLIAALISVALISGAGLLGNQLNLTFGGLASKLNNAK
ncbi:Flp family type IVb pilin [Rhizobium herbae]|jgi:pilus assembly protein Flp/PilA